MAFIEIGIWWNAKGPRGKAEHYNVVLVHPFIEHRPDGDYVVGWQPVTPDLFPAPF